MKEIKHSSIIIDAYNKNHRKVARKIDVYYKGKRLSFVEEIKINYIDEEESMSEGLKELLEDLK